MPKSHSKIPAALLVAEFPPELATVVERLSALETARRRVTEAHAEHEKHADRLETILAFPDINQETGEIATLQAQIQLAHARYHHAKASVDKLEDELAVAMSEAIPKGWRIISKVRDAIIERTAELLAPWFAKKGKAHEVAQESDAANVLFRLR